MSTSEERACHFSLKLFSSPFKSSANPIYLSLKILWFCLCVCAFCKCVFAEFVICSQRLSSFRKKGKNLAGVMVCRENASPQKLLISRSLPLGPPPPLRETGKHKGERGRLRLIDRQKRVKMLAMRAGQ